MQQVNITTSGVISGNTSQVYVIKNPLIFIYNPIAPWDWYTNTGNHNDNLWGDGTGKSAFDPCPKNWRVPPDASTTFGDFASTSTASGLEYTINAGRIYHNMAWFPAGGYRTNGGYGVLSGVGNYGYYWSAMIGGTSARTLYFNLSTLLSSSTGRRAGGFSVRCVQE